MARQHRFRLLTGFPRLMHYAAALALALLLSPAASLQAQSPETPKPPTEEEQPEHLEDEPPPPPPHPRFGGRGHKHGRGGRPPLPPPPEEPDLSKFSSEERERYERNKQRWEALAPEEKEALRQHHEERISRMKKHIDRAIEESGLKLTEEQRREFAHRFMSERRKIESELRQEMNRKRREAVDALIKRIAAEFKENAAEKKPAEKSE